jgi:hypothetical protein
MLVEGLDLNETSTPINLDGFNGRVEIWPPTMGRWPLLVARSAPLWASGHSLDADAAAGEGSTAGLDAWFSDLLQFLGPALKQLADS